MPASEPVQSRPGILLRVEGDTKPMLARRFTIICLLMSLFGMFFAILVAEAGRPARSWAETGSRTCSFVCPDYPRH